MIISQKLFNIEDLKKISPKVSQNLNAEDLRTNYKIVDIKKYITCFKNS